MVALLLGEFLLQNFQALARLKFFLVALAFVGVQKFPVRFHRLGLSLQFIVAGCAHK